MENNLDHTLKNYLSTIPRRNVVGVVLTGSFGRGNSDIYSDVDLVILTVNKGPTIQEGKFSFKNWPFDVRITKLKALQTRLWSSDEYFAYLNSKIIYDPAGKIRRLIIGKEREWKRSLNKKIILLLVQLSVIIDFKDNWRGLASKTHYQKSIARQDYLSAHQILNLGFSILLDLFYLLESKPPPDYKNKLRTFKTKLAGASKIAVKIKEFVQISNDGHEEARRKRKILLSLAKIVKESDLFFGKGFPKDFYQYYLENRT